MQTEAPFSMEEVDLKKDQTSVPGGKAGGAAYGVHHPSNRAHQQHSQWGEAGCTSLWFPHVKRQQPVSTCAVKEC